MLVYKVRTIWSQELERKTFGLGTKNLWYSIHPRRKVWPIMELVKKWGVGLGGRLTQKYQKIHETHHLYLGVWKMEINQPFCSMNGRNDISIAYLLKGALMS